MLNQLRDGEKIKYTLSIVTISLLTLSSTLSFAGEDTSNSTATTVSQYVVGTGSGVASVVSLTNAYQLSKAASLETSNSLSKANELKAQAQKPYTQEAENFENPKIKDAEAKIQRLIEEQNTLSAQLKVAKNAKNPAELLKLQQLENQLTSQRRLMRDMAITKYQQDIAEIRSWFPFDVFKKVSNYIDHGGKESHSEPKPTHAEFQIWENSKLQRTFNEYVTLDMQLKSLNAAKLRDGNHPIAEPLKQGAHIPPINIEDAEKRLTGIRQELAELKAWYPAAIVENARTRSASAQQIATTNFEPASKHFTVDEATELLSTHEKIQKTLTQSKEAATALRKQARPFHYIGALTLGASLVSFGSAVSDHLRKSETAARIEKENSSVERPDTTSTAKFE